MILGCAGTSLADGEKRFFREADPLGFILFANNCAAPDQIRALVAELRDSVGRGEAPVLIDQEGGRVSRLGPPEWRAAPPAARFGELAVENMESALEAARLNARLIAADLADLGINVDCAPVLDVPVPGAHDVIGDRAFSRDPAVIARLAGAAIEGFLAGGVIPVVKHMPGHGRAMADSHVALPVVDADRETLEATDFLPFRELSDAPWAMVAHLLYRAVDREAPATTSRKVIDEVIRGSIGFEGVLLSDDLSMEALSGTLAERARAVLAAGCDVALHCSGKLDEMESLAAELGRVSEAAAARLARAEAMRASPPPTDRVELEARLGELLQA